VYKLPKLYADRNAMELGQTYMNHVMAMTAEGLHAKSDIAAELAFRDKQIEALQAFKDYVHGRLDAAGVPTHPEGEHSAAGCRIGDRLDIALARFGK